MSRFAVALAAVWLASCRFTHAPIDVAVVFANSWTLAGVTFQPSDQSVVKTTALETLRRAYAGFDVRFAETIDTSDANGPRARSRRVSADRTIRVEETQYASAPSLRAPGAAGMTYPVATVSSVRIDVLLTEELAAAGCRDLRNCARPRAELLEGLGRGIGATGAHELGHQVGIRFVNDVPCDECYDGSRSTSAAHFFAPKHWSPEAVAGMKRALPAAPSR